MGSIGHDVLMYKLNNWQIRAAVRGYYRQHRPIYEAARMLGLWTVSCQRSKNSPTIHLEDLIKFPWERSVNTELSDEDMQELEELMRKENEKQK